jgi:hypothetical protein
VERHVTTVPPFGVAHLPVCQFGNRRRPRLLPPWLGIAVTDLPVGTRLSGVVTLCPNWPDQLTPELPPKLTSANRVSPPWLDRQGWGVSGVALTGTRFGLVFLMQGQRLICSAGGAGEVSGYAGLDEAEAPG